MTRLVARPDLTERNRWEAGEVVIDLRIRLERKVSTRHVDKAGVGRVKLLWTNLLEAGSDRPATDGRVKRVTKRRWSCCKLGLLHRADCSCGTPKISNIPSIN